MKLFWSTLFIIEVQSQSEYRFDLRVYCTCRKKHVIYTRCRVLKLCLVGGLRCIFLALFTRERSSWIIMWVTTIKTARCWAFLSALWKYQLVAAVRQVVNLKINFLPQNQMPTARVFNTMLSIKTWCVAELFHQFQIWGSQRVHFVACQDERLSLGQFSCYSQTKTYSGYLKNLNLN